MEEKKDMNKYMLMSTLVLPFLSSCNLCEVLEDFTNGTAGREMGSTIERSVHHTYGNYMQPMLESNGTSAQERERQNMLQNASQGIRPH